MKQTQEMIKAKDRIIKLLVEYTKFYNRINEWTSSDMTVMKDVDRFFYTPEAKEFISSPEFLQAQQEESEARKFIAWLENLLSAESKLGASDDVIKMMLSIKSVATDMLAAPVIESPPREKEETKDVLMLIQQIWRCDDKRSDKEKRNDTGEIIKEWHNKLSSPTPASVEEKGEGVIREKIRHIIFNAKYDDVRVPTEKIMKLISEYAARDYKSAKGIKLPTKEELQHIIQKQYEMDLNTDLWDFAERLTGYIRRLNDPQGEGK